MDASGAAWIGRDVLTPVSRRLEVVALYDDEAACRQAMQLYSRLLKQFENEVAFQCHWWPLSQFGPAECATEAAEMAAGASLVLIALGRPGDLPVPVKRWIEGWLGQQVGCDAALGLMLAITGQEETSAHPAHRYLEDRTRKARAAFFSCGFAPEAKDGRLAAPQGFSSDSAPVLRWGINE